VCIAIEVTDGETLTVHFSYGVPASYVVGRPDEELDHATTLHLEEPIY